MKFRENKRAQYILIILVLISISLMGLMYLKKQNLKKLNSLSGSVDLDFSNNEFQQGKVNYSKVQKIFNSRCIACHACYESPCQLNLQSYEGIQRGVLESDIFNRYRIKESPATRLFEDANHLNEWRTLGFNDVIGNSYSSILLSAIRRGAVSNRSEYPNHYPDDRQCIHHGMKNIEDRMKDPRLAMPFGLPGLSQKEILTIASWIKNGAKNHEEEDLKANSISSAEHKIIKEWESFLNRGLSIKSDKHLAYKHHLTSRYLYEHLFLAHLFIKTSKRNFYTLIRSRTSCDSPDMISTRTPGTDPLVKNFYYCIVKFPGTVVNKNHLPYEISLKKLNWIKQLFIETKWDLQSDNPLLPPYQISGIESGLPGLEINKIDFRKLKVKADQLNLDNLKKSFEELPDKWSGILEDIKKEKVETQEQIAQNKLASNPFYVFRDVPQSSRYRFLLEDSYYHIMTFMKGTVCNGTLSVNAVQDQFYIFFLSPEVNQKLITPEVLNEYSFPARYGEETGFKIITALSKQAENRNKAREQLNRNLKKHFENGLPLNAIWDGDRFAGKVDSLTQQNQNAVLTIFRHNDSASIVRGPVGDLPKTAFVMDYATFERMAYNLVINFDVFGSIGHMILTRAYMDLIRTDAENLYLSFLPNQYRMKLKKRWYNDSKSITDTGILEKDSLNVIMRTLLEKAKLTQTQMEVFYKEGELTKIDQNKINFKENYNNPEEVHLEFIKKILFEYLGSQIIGKDDTLNWSKIKSVQTKSEIENKLTELSNFKRSEKIPYLHYFPELSFLVLGSSDLEGRKHYHQYYSLILNRQFNSISLMAGEDFRRMPEEETLSIVPRVVGYYPNQFFYVEDTEESVNEFVKNALSIKSFEDYNRFLNKYGIKRMDPEIWSVYDYIVAQYLIHDPVDAGYLDLSRYNFTN